jgi:hypothetical protein
MSIEDCEVKLGMKVQDVVTGVDGIVVVVSDYWHGATRIEIQPPKKNDGSVPEVHVADMAQIKIINPKPILDIPKAPAARFQFGQRAKDPVSGYRGTVMGRAVFLNGCVRVCVQAHQDNYIKGQSTRDSGTWFPEELLKEDGWTIKPMAEKVKKESRPGGPAPRPTREPRASF